jgi:hypothetical protein
MEAETPRAMEAGDDGSFNSPQTDWTADVVMAAAQAGEEAYRHHHAPLSAHSTPTMPSPEKEHLER